MKGNSYVYPAQQDSEWTDRPLRAKDPPPVAKRMPVLRDNQGKWLYDQRNQIAPHKIKLNPEMLRMKARWKREYGTKRK